MPTGDTIWTEKENAMLRELFPSTMSVKEIAKRIGRTEKTVRAHANMMGLRRVRITYHGCTEDCFNCPYPDCMKQGGFLQSY